MRVGESETWLAKMWHNVDFCRIEPRSMPRTNFHLNLILLQVMKIAINNYNFICKKKKLEQRIDVTSLSEFSTILEKPQR